MKLFSTVSICTLLLGSPGLLQAHNLLVQQTLEPDRIVVEAFYDDGTFAKTALVKLLHGDMVIAEGKTDAEGVCILKRPETGDYRIFVNAGVGHRRTIELHVEAAPVQTAPHPSREEMTQYPWVKVFIGVGCIAVLALVLWGRLRLSARLREPTR